MGLFSFGVLFVETAWVVSLFFLMTLGASSLSWVTMSLSLVSADGFFIGLVFLVTLSGNFS